MGASFKTRLFGGFDREDVISYIEKTAQEHREALESLRAELDALRQERDALATRQEMLQNEARRNSAAAEKFEELRLKADELSHRAEALVEENEALRADAEEYRKMKDHIAEIEISAHRRTEEFRAQAIAQLHELTKAQRDWFQSQQEQLFAIHRQVQEQIEGARRSLGEVDLSGFAKILDSLNALDQKLDE